MRVNIVLERVMATLFSAFLFLGLLLYSQPSFAQGENPLRTKTFFAHWAQGGGYESKIRIDNITPLSGQVGVTFYRSDGSIALSVIKDVSKYGSVTVDAPVSATLLTGGAVVESLTVRFRAQLLFRYPFGDELIFSDEQRSGFTISSEFDRSRGLTTGIALFNPTSKPLAVAASLKDPEIRDGTGDPALLATKTIVLNPNGQTSAFIDQAPLFDQFFATRNTFRGSVEFVVSDFANDATNLDTQVVSLAVRFLTYPDGRFNFSSLPVAPLPYQYQSPAATASTFNVVYFVAKGGETSAAYDPNYERHFRALLTLAEKFYGDESERMGLARRTFDVARDRDGQIRVEFMSGNLTVADYMLPDGINADCNKIHREIQQRQVVAPVVFIAVPSNWDGGSGTNGCLAYQGPTTSLAEARGLRNLDYLKQLDHVSESDSAMFALLTTIHELGHNFGLPHTFDFDNDPRTKGVFESIMGASTSTVKVDLSLFPDLWDHPLLADPRRFWQIPAATFAASEVSILRKSMLREK